MPTRPDANRLRPVAPFDMVVFGGTGDLAMRKLMPALLRRDIDGQIAPESRIIGIGRSAIEDSAYARRVEESCRREVGEAFTEKSWSSFARTRAGADFSRVACQRLGEADLVTPDTRVVLEKPIGHDLASSKAINALCCARRVEPGRLRPPA
jgi:glucose-6-phosphate 1-dehydrogenase